VRGFDHDLARVGGLATKREKKGSKRSCLGLVRKHFSSSLLRRKSELRAHNFLRSRLTSRLGSLPFNDQLPSLLPKILTQITQTPYVVPHPPRSAYS
jgi:hypothetical protein